MQINSLDITHLSRNVEFVGLVFLLACLFVFFIWGFSFQLLIYNDHHFDHWIFWKYRKDNTRSEEKFLILNGFNVRSQIGIEQLIFPEQLIPEHPSSEEDKLCRCCISSEFGRGGWSGLWAKEQIYFMYFSEYYITDLCSISPWVFIKSIINFLSTFLVLLCNMRRVLVLSRSILETLWSKHKWRLFWWRSV